MAIIGFFLGLKTQGARFDVLDLTIATTWAGLIGFGFGSIFSQRPIRKWLVIYWATTLGLVGAFFGPLLPLHSFLAQETSGAAVGVLVGALVGVVQLRAARRVPCPSNLTAEH